MRGSVVSLALLTALVGSALHSRTAGAQRVRVPFELRGDNLVVAAEVNGERLMLILDTGSGISVFDPVAARRARLDSVPTTVRVIGTTATRTTRRIAKVVRLGDAVLHDMPVAAIDLRAVQERLGHDVAGTIGYELFQRYVVAIDFAGRTLDLFEPGTFEYEGRGVSVPIVTTTRVPVATVGLETRTRGTVTARLLIDLGSAAFAIKLARNIVERHRLDRDTTTVPGILGIGVGGAVEGELLRLPAAHLGALRLERPSVALSRHTDGGWGRGAEEDGVVGLNVFRRTRMIVDYPRSRIIFEPVARLDVGDTVDGSGLGISDERTAEAHVSRVMHVVPGSVADVAGIRMGDEIVSIDGSAMSSLSQSQRKELMREEGATRTLVVRRGNRSRTVVLRLRQII